MDLKWELYHESSEYSGVIYRLWIPEGYLYRRDGSEHMTFVRSSPTDPYIFQKNKDW